MWIDIPSAVPETSILIEDAVPLCVARPETSGVSNVAPITVVLGDSGMQAQIVGGSGVCFWISPSRWTVKLYWPGKKYSLRDTLDVITKPNVVTRVNVCVSPITKVELGWALKPGDIRCPYK